MKLFHPSNRAKLKSGAFLATVVVVSCIFLAAIRSSSLGLDKLLGHWMWFYYPRDISDKVWFVYLIFSIAMVMLLVLKRLLAVREPSRNYEIAALLFLVAIAFFLNVGFFSLSVYGLDELPQIIIHAGRTSYFTDAMQIDSVSHFLRTYSNQIEGLTHHSQVHGPGPIILFRSVYNAFYSTPWAQGLFIGDELNLNIGYLKNLLEANEIPGNNAAVATSVFMGLLFPMVLSLTIIPVYYLGRRYYGRLVAIMACGIFMVLPNTILFTPQLSQLMTLFAGLLCWSFLAAINKRSYMLTVLSGVIAAVSIFFGLEVLALIPFLLVGGWLTLAQGGTGIEADETIKPSGKTVTKDMLIMLSVLALTVLACFAFIYVFTGFNVIESYYRSMTIHDVLEARRPYLKWLWANPIEYFLYLGLPVLALLLRSIIRQWQSWSRGGTSKLKPLLISFVVTLVLMDISGINRGEVARLWMFLGPIVSILAAAEIKVLSHDIGRPSSIAISLIFIALIFFYAVGLKGVLIPLPLGPLPG